MGSNAFKAKILDRGQSKEASRGVESHFAAQGTIIIDFAGFFRIPSRPPWGVYMLSFDTTRNLSDSLLGKNVKTVFSATGLDATAPGGGVRRPPLDTAAPGRR